MPFGDYRGIEAMLLPVASRVHDQVGRLRGLDVVVEVVEAALALTGNFRDGG